MVIVLIFKFLLGSSTVQPTSQISGKTRFHSSSLNIIKKHLKKEKLNYEGKYCSSVTRPFDVVLHGEDYKPPETPLTECGGTSYFTSIGDIYSISNFYVIYDIDDLKEMMSKLM